MINIIEKEGQFIAISPKDNSISIGKTLQEAYTKAKGDDKNDKIINSSLNNVSKTDVFQNLKLFFIKLISILIILSLFSFFLFNQIEKNLIKISSKFDNIGGSRFWNKIEKEIISSASVDNAISSQKKEELLKALKVHIDNFKPFISEIGELFQEGEEKEAGG